MSIVVNPNTLFNFSQSADGLTEENILQLRHNLTDMMKGFNQISAFVLLVMTVFAIPGKGMEIKQCRGVDLDIAEDHVMHMNECLKEAGAKEVAEIEPSKMPCFGKCVFSKKGLIDTNGKPHKEKLQGLIIEHMPKVVHDDLNKKVATCLLPNATDIIDPADESCTTYLPMLMCIHVAFLEECEAE